MKGTSVHVKNIMELNSSVIIRFEIFLQLFGCENFSKPWLNGPFIGRKDQWFFNWIFDEYHCKLNTRTPGSSTKKLRLRIKRGHAWNLAGGNVSVAFGLSWPGVRLWSRSQENNLQWSNIPIQRNGPQSLHATETSISSKKTLHCITSNNIFAQTTVH